MQLGGYQSTLDDPKWFSLESLLSKSLRFTIIELFCQERPSADFFMKAETLSCAQSLFRTAIGCALQDIMISAGVIITVPRGEFYYISSGGPQTTENVCRPYWRAYWSRGMMSSNSKASRGLWANMEPICMNTSGIIEEFRKYSLRTAQIAWKIESVCLMGVQVTQNHRTVLPINCPRLCDWPKLYTKTHTWCSCLMKW